MQKLIATCSVAALLLIAGLAVFRSMASSAASSVPAPATAQTQDNRQENITLQAGPAPLGSEVRGQHTVLLAGSVSGNIWWGHH